MNVELNDISGSIKTTKKQTVSNPLEHVVSRIDTHRFFDLEVSYSHVDFSGKADDDSCIYLDIKYDMDELLYRTEEEDGEQVTMMLNKKDIIEIAKRFKLTADDLSC
jgi:hypothetical protein